jgi:sterol desaturase/sphingolipid hydroxylase (fatty acid hydroxylase superfamily)
MQIEIAQIASDLPLVDLSIGAVRRLGRPAAIFSLLFALESLSGAPGGRYLSRSFLIDLLHFLFYGLGMFIFLVLNPVVALLMPFFELFRFPFLSSLPPVLAYPLIVIYGDFVSYWIHRAQHRSKLLWSFHSVHHTATRLTSVTVFRRHIGESIVASIIKYALIFMPLQMVVKDVWYAGMITLAIEVLVSMHHAELDWNYGFLSRVLVSPVFHGIHHSSNPEHHHANFGMLLSVWDHLFGTAIRAEVRPGVYGLRDGALDQMGLRETVYGQTLAPLVVFFSSLFRRSPRRYPEIADA